MENGYHQIAVYPSNIMKMAFVTQYGQFEYLRMPFGLKTEPRTLQRCLVNIFENIPNVIIYLDDLLLYPNEVKSHLKTLSIVFEILAKNQIKLNLAKSLFFKTQITYLGSTISGNSISVDQSRLPAFEKIVEPKNFKDLRKLIGFSNWFRPFVPKISLLLSPLNNKLSQKEFNWNNDDSNTLKRL